LVLSAYLAECLGHFEIKTLLKSCSALCKDCFFLYQAIQLVVCAELAQARVFWDLKFCFLQTFFPSHHVSSTVSASPAKVFFQEAHAQFHTLAARQDEYYTQDSQRVEGF
jgi:hypothetical protein